MNISEKICVLRDKFNMSQEALAEKLDVSRQSVQKWESGASTPTIDKLVLLAKLFNVSMDYLCGEPSEEAFDSRLGKEYVPDYNKMHNWESYAKSLMIEYRELKDEGKDVENLEELFRSVSNLPNSKEKDAIADEIFKIADRLPLRKDYPFVEPNDLDSIKALRPQDTKNKGWKIPEKSVLEDKMYGGWTGRICGCYLGKPVECIRTPEFLKVLKRTKNYPLSRYIDKEDVDGIDVSDITFPIKDRSYPKNYGRMPFDDDTNYILIAYKVLEKYGRDFTSDGVADIWLTTQTKYAYCTAERVAYINLVNGYIPPASGEYKNAYREWIGAQIRADFYGYINPCDPETAVDMAYRDARISHTKNGIYGSMWVAAMIAAAYGTKDIKEIIEAGLSQIPSTSRLFKAVKNVIAEFESGKTHEEVAKRIHTDWDEFNGYDWCHTISNAEIVTASLLYGSGDYGKSICLAAGTAFDTDCNGATVGSILGVMLGYHALPSYWKDRICDTLEATLLGMTSVSVSDMAKKSLAFLPLTLKD